MNNIGICFPGSDFEIMPAKEFKDYLLRFKEAGITSFDFYTKLFLNNTDKLTDLVQFLNKNDIKITFHYQSIDNIDLISVKEDYDLLYDLYQKELSTVRSNLIKLDVKYKTTIVFHALDYFNESRKYNHEQHIIDVFRKLSVYGKELDFEILIETLSRNYPVGHHIGDDLGELEDFVNGIDSDNFGICWDIGHTRLNNIENNTSLCLSEKVIEKVKFAHIHNIHLNKDNRLYLDHLPLTRMSYPKEELAYLLKKEYKGVFSIEVGTEHLKENILVYLDSIKLLKEMLESLKEEIK